MTSRGGAFALAGLTALPGRTVTTRAARLLAAVLGGFFAIACGGAGRPNIVLIVLDTARQDRFTFDGYGRPTTPRLAAVAAEGAVYEQAYTPAPWTLPAHASLFTGLHPSSHGADSLHRRLDASGPTLAEALRDRGYRTVAYVGNPWVGKSFRFDRGFDRFEEIWRQVDEPAGSGAELINRNVERFILDRGQDVTERDRPFFLFINYLEPHLPYDPPEPERSRFLRPGADPARVGRLRAFKFPEEMRVVLGLASLAAEDLEVLSDLYDGEIAYLDRRVGEITDFLRSQGLLDRTVLAVTSDHGEAIGEHGMLDHKLSVYDELLRIPMLLRHPPAVAPGQRIQRPVMLQDLYPTLLALAGVPRATAAPDLSGSAPGDLPLIEAAPLPGVRGLDPGMPRPVLVAEFARPVTFLDTILETFPGYDFHRWDRALVAWRAGEIKLQWGSDGRHHLYDLAADPGETRDLAAAEPARAAGLASRVDTWLSRRGARSIVEAPR